MADINEWLDGWVDTHINTPQYEDDKSHMAQDAEVLKAQAVESGFTLKELTDACGGDILDYLQSAQNSLTDDHIEYLKSRDKD